jgi:glycosyltransferase involved in cell wall biosynthesis
VRVLTVGNMYPPHHLGGYELIWRDAVVHLRDGGHEVRVLTTDFHRDGAATADREEVESDVHRELHWYWRDHKWPRISIPDRIRLEKSNAATLDRHLQQFGPDVVGWWAMGGMSLAMIERTRRKQIPGAGFICDEWLAYGPDVDGWMRLTRQWPAGLLGERLTGIPTAVDFSRVGPWLFMSETLRNRAISRWALADTAVAHKGVDPTVFFPADPSPWGWRLLCAGRIDPRKGIDLAVRALPGLPKASLEIVGDGDTEHLADLHELARQQGVADRVHFHPGESRERLRQRYAAADAVLFPVTWNEPWGLVPLEAMAVGTPVIASGRGGSGEYLEDGVNCLLFEPDRGPAALVEKVTVLAEDEGLRLRLREGGAATSGAIPADGFSDAVVETLARAARSPARSPA